MVACPLLSRHGNFPSTLLPCGTVGFHLHTSLFVSEESIHIVYILATTFSAHPLTPGAPRSAVPLELTRPQTLSQPGSDLHRWGDAACRAALHQRSRRNWTCLWGPSSAFSGSAAS